MVYSTGGYVNAQSFCQNLGNDYRVPNINDYTNANGNDWTGGIPARNSEWYQRSLSYQDASGNWIGGLFNEWGWTSNGTNNSINAYPESDWDFYNVWAYQPHNDMQYYVSALGGGVYFNYPSVFDIRAACVTP
ncbi:hypothetical protein [Gilliamella sp. Bif1-4]|uniref:hypothetical protein n=1 Tax=Gilliamella sp. Bif1-4 TaxID=3120233 RepID=UPI00080EBACB|nr:hypothetical protein [Gilliamella apicola]OCG39893.1 hypothetical protein A9G25_10955 [Gilliamella apicola]